MFYPTEGGYLFIYRIEKNVKLNIIHHLYIWIWIYIVNTVIQYSIHSFTASGYFSLNLKMNYKLKCNYGPSLFINYVSAIRFSLQETYILHFLLCKWYYVLNFSTWCRKTRVNICVKLKKKNSRLKKVIFSLVKNITGNQFFSWKCHGMK